MDFLLSATSEPSQSLAAAAGKMLTSYFSAHPHAGAPISHPTALAPTQVGHLTHHIHAPQARSILAACKQHGLGLTAAFHAAVINTVYTLTPAAHRNRALGMTVPYNARPYAKAPYNGDEYPVMLVFANTLYTIPGTNEVGDHNQPNVLKPGDDGFFMHVAKAMNRKYRARLDRPYPGKGDPSFLEYNKPFISGYRDILMQAATAPKEEPENVEGREGQIYLSSLGHVDKNLSSDGVQPVGSESTEKVAVGWSDFELQLDLGTHDLTTHMWGEDEELRFGVTWNEAYWERKHAEGVVQMVMGCLEKHLLLSNAA